MMDGQINRQTDGQMDRRTDGQGDYYRASVLCILVIDRWTDKPTDSQTDGQGDYCRLFADFVWRGLKKKEKHLHPFSPGAYVVPVNMNVNFWQHA